LPVKEGQRFTPLIALFPISGGQTTPGFLKNRLKKLRSRCLDHKILSDYTTLIYCIYEQTHVIFCSKFRQM